MAWIILFLSSALALVGFLLLRIAFQVKAWSSQHKKIWLSLDTVGVRSGGGAFSWAVAMAKSVTALQVTMREGYEKFSKAQNRPFLLPSMWVGGAVIVLPPSMLPQLNRPTSEVTSFFALLENAQFQYLMTDKAVWANTQIHFDVVRKDMTQKHMTALGRIMEKEWAGAFQREWGINKKGKVVDAWDSAIRIIARVSLRIMVGVPGCRNEDYLEQSRLYAHAVIVDGVLINCMHPAMRPILAPIVALRARYYARKVIKLLVPFIEERIRQSNESKGQDDGEDLCFEGDVVRWIIAKSVDGTPKEMDPRTIAQRVLALTSMFIFAIGWVFLHGLLDIHTSPNRDEWVAGIEEECRRVAGEHHGLATQEAVNSLHRLDSAVRESMRVSDVMVHILPLDVVSRSIDLGDGLKITPQSGVRTVFPVQMIHNDKDWYQEPERFDAFRFSRKFEHTERMTHASKRETMTTITPSYLPFGYGRHSCPGRWFVAQMVKQGLGYVFLKYDAEVTRMPPPKRTAMLNFMLPPEQAQIRVTRKT